MVAAMGYITPEVAGQLPGHCSFSVSLKLADISNGLTAFFDDQCASSSHEAEGSV